VNRSLGNFEFPKRKVRTFVFRSTTSSQDFPEKFYGEHAQYDHGGDFRKPAKNMATKNPPSKWNTSKSQ